jgi:hypothetical protein
MLHEPVLGLVVVVDGADLEDDDDIVVVVDDADLVVVVVDDDAAFVDDDRDPVVVDDDCEDVVTGDVVTAPHENRTLVTVTDEPELELQETVVGPEGGLQGAK